MIRKLFALACIGFIFLLGCNHKTDYRQMVKQELARNVRNDTLFMGYYFGMPRQEFYDHSWKMNSQKKIVQGQGNLTIRYDGVKGLGHKAHLNYYPLFYNEKIYKMQTAYSYDGWAPWNRNLWSDSLEVRVLDKLRKKYSKRFIKMKHPELDVPAYIMVDGNKRIAVYRKGDEKVVVNYLDLTVSRKIKKE